MLSNFPIISTNRPEVAEAILSSTLSDVQILKIENRAKFHLLMNGVNIGNSSHVFNRYFSNAKVITGRPVDSVVLILGNNKPSTFRFDNGSVTVSQNRAACLMPGERMEIERSEGSEILVLKTNLTDLKDVFSNLTNKYHHGPFVFDRYIDLTKGAGAILKRMVRYISSEIDHNNEYLQKDVLSKGFEHILQSAILSTLHKQRNQLFEERKHHQYEPSFVRVAEEYMKAHLNESVSIVDLLKACGCSRSVLFAAFKNARGCSPMKFLTEQRLQSAREKLVMTSPEGSVSHIAMNCGFNDLSRFSRAYKKRFGELPSETLRKKR